MREREREISDGCKDTLGFWAALGGSCTVGFDGRSSAQLIVTAHSLRESPMGGSLSPVSPLKSWIVLYSALPQSNNTPKSPEFTLRRVHGAYTPAFKSLESLTKTF